jgi:precorrin-3B synthase
MERIQGRRCARPYGMIAVSNPVYPAGLNGHACPGLLRMRPARDGALCRVKLELGELSAAQAEAVAGVAEAFGSGVIEATNRGNLQLRGIRADAAGAVIGRLIDAGLGPRVPEADDIRNVMVSPLAGRDVDGTADVRPLARQVLATLQNDRRYFSLSPKFSILIDGGESVAMTGHAHDIWLSASPVGAAIGIAGWPPLADEHIVLGLVGSDDAHAAIVTLLDIFLEATALRDRLCQRIDLGAAADWRRAAPRPSAPIGIVPQSQRGLVAVGAMPPLGRLDPRMLRALAHLARAENAGTIRVTPWQSILLADIPAPRATRVVQALTVSGLVCDDKDSRSQMIACSGSAGCASALADTQKDGAALAQLVAAGADVHVSGCSKSCAAAHVASVTLLAASPGHYDVFIRDNAAASRFGRRVAANATVAEAATAIDQNRSSSRA